MRRRSRDVIALFNSVAVGIQVLITDAPPTHLAVATIETRGTEWYR